MENEYHERLAYLTDPTVSAVGRLPAHSDLTPLESDGAPLFFLDLAGTWKFRLFSRPDALDPALLLHGEPGETVEAPGHLQLQGYGAPQYVNVQYPWDGLEAMTPPAVPEENPTALYVRTFSLPPEAAGRRTRLVLDGVEPCCFVYCNGGFIGYAEDSFTPSEFDLTDALHPGENRLALVVPRYCSGSWLEDQDFWRFFGVFRGVRLLFVPDVMVEDASLLPDVAEDLRSGTLSASVCISARAAADAVVALTVAGRTAEARVRLQPGRQTVPLSVPVPAPLLWSAETPHLYAVDVRVSAPDGAFLAAARAETGFRRFALSGGRMLLNGKRIVFYGVNRHEWSEKTGRAIDAATIEADVRLLKQNNCNAVRTSHYPNNSDFYRLCDRYGLYVIDETNLETHGTWQAGGESLPGDDPAWREAVLDRGRSMLERDKNHPCVLLWSCGNESRGGRTLFDLARWFRARDEKRLVHYEGIFWDRTYPGTSDIESRMYEKPDALAAVLSEHPDTPVILCEYAHAMGNSFGNVEEYTALLDRFGNFQGGFVWDFVDQALALPAPDGGMYLATGYDEGLARPTDAYFCGDGLWFADRTPSPKLAEAKYLYQPLDISCAIDHITVRNRHLFLSTEGYAFFWTLDCDGTRVQEGTFALAVLPGETGVFPLPLADAAAAPGEWVLTASAVLKDGAPYAPAGHEVAFGQAVVRTEPRAARAERPAPPVPGIANIGARFSHGFALLSRPLGSLYALNAGRELLTSPVTADFWRAPTDNDVGCGAPLRWANWKIASLYRFCTSLDAGDGGATARFFTPGLPESGYTVRYRFFQDDALTVTLSLDPTPGDVPRFGLTFAMPAAFDRLSWYGNTAREAESDRRNALRLGLGAGRVDDQFVPYLHPQHCGTKTDVRWFSVRDADGYGLVLSSDLPFFASALPYTSHELEQAKNRLWLPPKNKTVVGVYSAQCGVGGDDSWGAPVHDAYRVSAAEGLSFTVRVQLVRPGDGLAPVPH